MTREKALEFAQFMPKLDGDRANQQIADVMMSVQAQTAARCIEIIQQKIDTARYCGNETGCAELARNEIRRDFPAMARTEGGE